MGYELTYEDGKFYVWSTVSSGYISDGLNTPTDVANFILNRPIGQDVRTKQEREKIFRIWYNEALKVREHPEEGVQIVATMEISGIKEGKEPVVRKFDEPIRMTPKLKDLEVRYRIGE